MEWVSSQVVGVGSNTDLYIRATTNGLRALITVNTNQNCDQIRPGDCVPIFKTIDVEAVKKRRTAA